MELRNGKENNFCWQPPKAWGYRRKKKNVQRGNKFAKPLNYAYCESYELKYSRKSDSFIQNCDLRIKRTLCIDIKRDMNNLECVQKRTTSKVRELRTLEIDLMRFGGFCFSKKRKCLFYWMPKSSYNYPKLRWSYKHLAQVKKVTAFLLMNMRETNPSDFPFSV